MLTRKIWAGDILYLEAGNAFFGDEVVHCRAGIGVARETCEEGDPIVSFDGYFVPRYNLRELEKTEGRMVSLELQLSIPEALNGIGKEERLAMMAELNAEPLVKPSPRE
jgi:predicted butyrate kinase (DUF1464 family)